MAIETEHGAVVQGLASGDVVSFDSLDIGIVGWPFSGAGAGLRVVSSAGTVFVHDCTVEGEGIDFGASPQRGYAGIIVDGASLIASESYFEGSYGVVSTPAAFEPGPGLLAINSRVQLDDCEVEGRDGYDAEFAPDIPATPGGVGMRMIGSRVSASRSTFEAGDGGDGLEFVPGFCLSPAAGGHAIEIVGPGPSVIDVFNAQFEPGMGGTLPAVCGGGTADSGQDFGGSGVALSSIDVNPNALGLDAPAVFEGGTSVSVSVVGVELMSPKWVLFSGGAMPNTSLGFDGFPVMVLDPIVFVELGADGTETFATPNLPFGVSAGFFLQGLELPSSLIPLLHPMRFVGVY